jgi:hypothetical protein
MARWLLAAVVGALLAGVVASPAAGIDVRRMQVEIETRTVVVTRGQVEGLGIAPGVAEVLLRCDPGEVALSAGASTDAPGLSVLTSLPTGPRGYRVELGNFALTDTTVRVSALCARVIGAPRLAVSTGTVAVEVPEAALAGATLVPGTARVTGICTNGATPVGSGVDLGSEGVLRVAQSYPSGPRRLIVVVRNFALSVQDAVVAVRCVDLPDGFGVTRHAASAVIPPATGQGASLQPGETEGAKKCPSGKAMIGGGHRAPENAFAETFPTIRNVPALGYLFRSVSREQETGSISIFCTPRVVRTDD